MNGNSLRGSTNATYTAEQSAVPTQSTPGIRSFNCYNMIHLRSTTYVILLHCIHVDGGLPCKSYCYSTRRRCLHKLLFHSTLKDARITHSLIASCALHTWIKGSEVAVVISNQSSRRRRVYRRPTICSAFTMPILATTLHRLTPISINCSPSIRYTDCPALWPPKALLFHRSVSSASTDHLLNITDRDNSIEPSLRPDPINRFDSKHRPHPATTPPSTPTMPRGPAVSPPMASSIKKAQAASQTRTFRGERTLSLVVRLSFALSRVVTIA
uniref:Uncharacterized protein n=1 Tax=Panagrellus redivivus TaxID=6233 RepID=A0A7E4W9M7_PANRE